ncbi:MAG: hypothetical protein GY877_11135 [Hyphomicrobium sp.]|nr:hypothetical protein [Hyphomicrobium sp.]
MAGWTWACGALLAAGAVLAPANAQELSEKATQTFMEYAWQLTPAAFTKPDGTTIQIDKKKKGDVMVPLDVARKIIRAGRLSAHAQVCELAQDQSDNHNSLMRRHLQSKKWTPQQLVYINQLHLTTVMLLTGRIMLVERQGDKEVVVEEEKRKAQTCSDEQKQKVKEMIAAYVKSGPSLTKKAASTSAGDAQPAATAPVKKE